MHLPTRSFAAGAALAFVLILMLAPMGGVAQAASPMHGGMVYDDAGSAHFSPNELPGAVMRDNGDRCDWWGYKLVGGRYVRYHCPCRYGDEEVDYSLNYRAMFQLTTTSSMAGSATEIAVPVEATEAASAAEEASAEEPVDAGPAAQADGMDATAGASEFATLLAAVGAAEVDSMLRDVGPFTVFAPTDAAFAEMAGVMLGELLQAPSAELVQIVLYHVVPGTVMASDLTDGMMVDTLQGSQIMITVDGDSIMVNDANIVTVDVETANGVIHIIDSVLVPAAQ